MGNIISGNIITIFNRIIAYTFYNVRFEATKEKYTENEMVDIFEKTTGSNLLWYAWTVHCDICHQNYKLDTPSNNPNYSSKCVRKECNKCNKFYDICNTCTNNINNINCPFCLSEIE